MWKLYYTHLVNAMVHQAIIYKDQNKPTVDVLLFSAKYAYAAPFATSCSMLDAGLRFTTTALPTAETSVCIIYLQEPEPEVRLLSRVRGTARQQLGVPLGLGLNCLKHVEMGWNGMGQSFPFTCPPNPIPLSLLHLQGESGHPSLPDQKKPISHE